MKSELALVKKVCACEVCEYGAYKELRKYNIKICSMTFYFSFEVLLKLKPIQTNIKGGGASNQE